jgi:signal transduction histidine kinase/ligand-binding sensor domain-containing protein/DNA-binding response OmpR family regulator
MPNKHYLPACLCLLLPFLATAQTAPVHFTALSSKDGLLSNSVNAIVKDRYGLMWFATDDGLNKFDGTNFTVYRHQPGDTGSLRANEVLALYEDRSGNLWVGTGGGGLSRYDRKKDAFVHYPLQGGVAGLTGNSVIRGIGSDHTGKLWLAQYDAVYILDPVTNNVVKPVLPAMTKDHSVKNVFLFICEDSKRRLWIGTDNGLLLYTRETNTFRPFVHREGDAGSLPNDRVGAIAEDRQGNIWFGTANGLCRLQPDGQHFTSYASIANSGNRQINCIAVDDDNLLWVGSSEGLLVFNPQTGHTTSYAPARGKNHALTSKYIRCAYIDKQGIYWFGTFRGGINKYDKNLNLFNLKTGSQFEAKGYGAAVVSAFAEAPNGNIYIGTDGDGLFQYDRVTEQLRPVPVQVNGHTIPVLTVLALHINDAHQLYIGSYGYGLFILDLATGKCRHLQQDTGPNSLCSNDIFCFKEDRKGNTWIGFNGAGVTVLNNERVVAKFVRNPTHSNEYPLPLNGYIRSIEEDSAGNIWIASHGAGIAVYHPAAGKWTIYKRENSGLASDKVQTLFFDSKNRMWAGTFGGGLNLFDNRSQQFITFGEKDGLQNTTVYQILEDKQGLLWLSSNTGLSSLNPVNKAFRNYTCYNGVQNNNFVHQSGLRLSDGTLFFGGLDGFNYFDPAGITINHNVPPVLFTDLKISNKSVVAGGKSPIKEHISIAREIRLDYKQNFALSFVALNYTIPRQNHYAYKLEGFDKDWNYTGTVNTASYTNLDPGDYVFHVKASNNDGVWTSRETTIKIYVKPPFWRTTCAYIFYVAVFAGLLLYSRHRGITRLQKKFAIEQERQEARRIQELDRLKLKFLTNLSHEFRTPISLIMGPVDQLIDSEPANDRLNKLQMVKRNTRRLLNLVNQLLDFRKMEEQELTLQLAQGEFISFVKEVVDSFKDLAERKSIRFSFTSDLQALDVLFDRDKIERILFNVLSNAFKFTLEGGAVGVAVKSMDQPGDPAYQWVAITICDSGIGIPKDKQQRIFDRFFQNTTASGIAQGTGIGLSITKEFVTMHGGSIHVSSEPGKGSIFTIQVPLQLYNNVTPVTPETTATANPYAIPAAASGKETGEALVNHMPLVLLVEDNADVRFYLKENLKNNYAILEAVNGKEGWQKALAHHPQLIVSDVSMPQMDGLALVKKLKADKRTAYVPVILLTGLTTQQQQLQGLETGASDYITKPFNVEVLNAKIKSLLELNSTLKNTYTKQIKVISPEINVESADEKLLQSIVSYLEDNLANPQLSVEVLSRQVGMSRSSLYIKLLELTGETPVEYIRSFRLKRAASLMEKGNTTIAEVAYQVGFSTPNYFARSFRNQFHMAPSEFIARTRKKENNNQL